MSNDNITNYFKVPLAAIADTIVAALRDGHKLLIVVNGGSADVQRIVAEIVGRPAR